MGNIKQIAKWLIYSLKYRNKNVKFHKNSQLAIGNVIFEGNNRIGENTSFCGKLGFGSYIGNQSNINAIIGKYCSIASDVHVISGKHPTTKFVSTHPAFFSTKCQAGFTYVENELFDEEKTIDANGHLVEIGNDVWIGSGVKILSGVHIGDGAIIAAGAIVCKDIQPYSIVGGVPAKLIRKRFTDEQIVKLKSLKWWDKEETWIQENSRYFANIDEFLERNKGEK